MVTQVALKNHPGLWLAPDAAASLERLEAAHGVFKINSAGRTKAEQDALIARWAKGGAANRPPYLYQPAPSVGPNISWHQAGEAFDTPDIAHLKAFGKDYGWTFDVSSDVVHLQYHPNLDKHRPGTAPAGTGATPATPVFNQADKDRQGWLIANGYNLGKSGADGLRGPATIAAYKAYQAFLRAYGYTGAIDGIWGPETQAAHQRFYDSKHAAAPVAATGPLSYADIQRGLNKFGYGLAVDNIWGKKSHNALGDFQHKHNLRIDYLVGPQTRAALGI